MIVDQQVSLASAASVWARLQAGLGEITPEALLAHDLESLKGMGLSRQKATYGQGIARAQLDGTVDLEHLSTLDDEEAIAALVSLKGVGLWTAEAYLLICEGRMDVFPGGDIALQEAIKWADRLEAPAGHEGGLCAGRDLAAAPGGGEPSAVGLVRRGEEGPDRARGSSIDGAARETVGNRVVTACRSRL